MQPPSEGRPVIQMNLLMPVNVVWSGMSEPVLFSEVLAQPNLAVSRLEIVLFFFPMQTSVNVKPSQLSVLISQDPQASVKQAQSFALLFIGTSRLQTCSGSQRQLSWQNMRIIGRYCIIRLGFERGLCYEGFCL